MYEGKLFSCISHPPQQFFCSHFHLVEREPALAEVFQGGTDMIDGVVDAEVAVVYLVVYLHVDGLILRVRSSSSRGIPVLFEVERKLLLDLLGVDGGRHLRLALVEHRQHGIIDIVVEQHNTLLGRADEVGNKSVGIENLPVEEDALCRGGVLLVESFEDFSNLIVVLCQVGRHLQLMMLNDLQSLKHLCIGGYEMTHSHKCIHDFYADINGCIAMKNRCQHGHSLLGENVRKRR